MQIRCPQTAWLITPEHSAVWRHGLQVMAPQQSGTAFRVMAPQLSPCKTRPITARLRALCQLLNTIASGPVYLYACVCAGLTKLTNLAAGFNRCAELHTYLPASLVRLCIGSVPLKCDAASQPADSDDPDAKRYLPPCAAGTGQPFNLKLSHLTAVTELDFLWEDESADWTALYLGDELPPNVRSLYAGVEHGAALAVLCPLQKLRFLELHSSGVKAEHLKALMCL